MVLALNAYRDAIQDRVFWEHHGRWGDGHLDLAKRAENKARRLLLAIMRGA